MVKWALGDTFVLLLHLFENYIYSFGSITFACTKYADISVLGSMRFEYNATYHAVFVKSYDVKSTMPPMIDKLVTIERQYNHTRKYCSTAVNSAVAHVCDKRKCN